MLKCNDHDTSPVLRSCHPEFISGSVIDTKEGQMLKQVQHDGNCHPEFISGSVIKAKEGQMLKHVQNDRLQAVPANCLKLRNIKEIKNTQVIL